MQTSTWLRCLTPGIERLHLLRCVGDLVRSDGKWPESCILSCHGAGASTSHVAHTVAAGASTSHVAHTMAAGASTSHVAHTADSYIETPSREPGAVTELSAT